jgi:hypothetical protein
MLTVTSYQKRQSKDGREFITLELQGGLEMVQSQETGRFYATVRKCSMPTTFDENIAKALVGNQVSGTIVRVSCDPYEYTVPSTGEVITLAHRWSYQPQTATTSPVPVMV